MSFDEYFAAPGLSASGMADLAISPFRFWHLHINPARPAEAPTAAMQFGTALHCAVLERESFHGRYACELNPADYPGALVTMEDLRGWLRQKGVTPKGTRKAEVIAQIERIDQLDPHHSELLDPPPFIWDVLEARHAANHEGKTLLSVEDFLRVGRVALALEREPEVKKILTADDGQAEVALFANDPETGVALKARMDWITPKVTLDIKTFTAKRGTSVDKAVGAAIWYEYYYRTAYFYTFVRSLQRLGTQPQREFVMAFVESEEPHEVRLKALNPKTDGQACLWWARARAECRALIDQYARCVEQFGTEPWRIAQDIEPLYDEDLPGLAY